MNSFSSKNRQAITGQMSSAAVDVLVIGGGITGAGIALDAAARGLTVALVDMQDFAAGTSGRSTKLIHGGLRYLKQLELKLVAEVGKEREIIHRIAPQLTRPETMLLPLVKGGSFNKFTIRLGMWLYELLAGVKKEERHKLLSASQTKAAEPLLATNGLLGGVLYYEYRTDDARLTIEVMKEAVRQGALALNYAKVTGFVYSNGKISGAKVRDQFTGNEFETRAGCVVNATGPWVDELDMLDNKAHGNKLNVTKGIHLVVDGKKLPVKQSLYFDTFDKRMIFVIPRDGKTYIGTTDTFYKGDKLHPELAPEDKNYLLKCVNAFFPNNQLALSDVESGWAGLRPLINKPGKGPSEISRKDELFVWQSGLMTIAGGKLTGYRKMAQRVVDKIAEQYKTPGKQLRACATASIPLAKNDLNASLHFNGFLKQKASEGEKMGLTKAGATALAYRYGAGVSEIFSSMQTLQRENYAGKLPLALHAQLLYAIEHELCCTPSDFFIRRTGALYFDIETVRQWKNELIQVMQKQLDWDKVLAEKLGAELQAAVEKL